MQSTCRHTNDPNTQPSMHEGFIQECPLVGGHAAIFPSLAVKHEIRGDDSTADDTSAVEEPLSHTTGVRARNLAARLHVGATEGLLEGISRLGEDTDGRNRLCGAGRGFQRAMECTACGLSGFGNLLDTRGDGHRPTKDKRHDRCCHVEFEVLVNCE